MSLNLEGAHGLNFLLGAGATAGANLTGLSGGATTYTTSAVNYSVNGVPCTNAANAGAASPTTDGNTAAAMTLVASQAAAFVWAVDASGTEKVYKGPTIAWNGTDVSLCPYPYVPSSVAVFAVHVIKGASTVSGTWTFGSSNWNATGITVGTITQCAGMLPPTPLTT